MTVVTIGAQSMVDVRRTWQSSWCDVGGLPSHDGTPVWFVTTGGHASRRGLAAAAERKQLVRGDNLKWRGRRQNDRNDEADGTELRPPSPKHACRHVTFLQTAQRE
jgi:hypothetical protein